MKDGKADHITREPEQVKAFRDTWRDGIHSYLTYLRDRLTVARDLLTDSGSIFVQIGDENVHRVRALMDEVFGDDNFVSQIIFKKTSAASVNGILPNVYDYLLWYARDQQIATSKYPYNSFDASNGFDWSEHQTIASDSRRSTTCRISELTSSMERLFKLWPIIETIRESTSAESACSEQLTVIERHAISRPNCNGWNV